MDKAKWDVMEARDKDGLIAERLFGFCWRVLDVAPFSSMKDDLGKRFLCQSYTASDYPEAKGSEEKSSEWDRFFSNYTTDRNACALVLDEIVQLDKGWTYLWHLMEILLNGEHGLDFEESGGLDALMAIHIVDPDMICYCAVEATEANGTT